MNSFDVSNPKIQHIHSLYLPLRSFFSEFILEGLIYTYHLLHNISINFSSYQPMKIRYVQGQGLQNLMQFSYFHIWLV